MLLCTHLSEFLMNKDVYIFTLLPDGRPTKR